MDDNSEYTTARRTSPASLIAVICGIAACLLNVFVVTAPLGFIFGVIALICALLAGRSTRGGRAGLTLAAVSMLILAVYAASVLVPLWTDPTERLWR